VDESPPRGPFSQQRVGAAEQPGLQFVDLLLHRLEVAGPEVRLLGADALLALPAHAMEEERAVAGDEPALARGEDQQAGRGALAQDDAGAAELALADEGGDRQRPIDAAAHRVEVEDAFAPRRDFEQGLQGVFFPVIDLADQGDFRRSLLCSRHEVWDYAPARPRQGALLACGFALTPAGGWQRTTGSAGPARAAPAPPWR